MELEIYTGNTEAAALLERFVFIYLQAIGIFVFFLSILNNWRIVLQ